MAPVSCQARLLWRTSFSAVRVHRAASAARWRRHRPRTASGRRRPRRWPFRTEAAAAAAGPSAASGPRPEPDWASAAGPVSRPKTTRKASKPSALRRRRRPFRAAGHRTGRDHPAVPYPEDAGPAAKTACPARSTRF